MKTHTWDLTPLYPSSLAWEKAFKKASAEVALDLFSSYKKGPYTPQKLHALLDLFFSHERNLKKLYTWAHLLQDEDLSKDAPKAYVLQSTSLLFQFLEKASFIEPVILSHTKKELNEFLKAKVLQPYHIYLSRLIRVKPFTLSEKEEKILALSKQPLEATHRAFSVLNDADFSFPNVKDSKMKEHALTHGSFQLLLKNEDRTLRKNAFTTLYKHYESFQNTSSELINGTIQAHLFEAKSRGYQSCLEASLFPKNIPLQVYHSLIDTVQNNISVLHRYCDLRKKHLKLKELHLWDMAVPLVQEEKASYSYDEAVDLIMDACAPLGKEYTNILLKGLTKEKWVDLLEKKGKRSGAYSSGCYDSFPYILMNYKGQLRDVYVLAHEAGHSMHSYYSRKTQPYHYSEYEIFVAEVASTFNENLLTRELLKRASTKQKKATIINEQLEAIRTTFFRQTMFAEFELFLHQCAEQSIPLTPKTLKEKYLLLNEFYFGKSVTIDPEISIEWSRVPHFYYNFYVYQYATGISAANMLADLVMKEGNGPYLSFLKGGSSKFSLDLLNSAGVSLTSSTPYQATIHRFSSLLQELETLLKS